jgi:low affinity Fe/Cu permease
MIVNFSLDWILIFLTTVTLIMLLIVTLIARSDYLTAPSFTEEDLDEEDKALILNH